SLSAAPPLAASDTPPTGTRGGCAPRARRVGSARDWEMSVAFDRDDPADPPSAQSLKADSNDLSDLPPQRLGGPRMSPEAGWYDDGSGRQRWWDGAQWTEHFAPAAADASVAAAHETAAS